VPPHGPPGEQAQQIWQQQRDLRPRSTAGSPRTPSAAPSSRTCAGWSRLKQQQGLKISLALPALNEEETIGEIIAMTQRTLMEETPLLDEIVLIDSGSDDRTREIAVVRHPGLHPPADPCRSTARSRQGRGVWKSLYAVSGDPVAWVDTDIRNFHPRFVYGPIGPMLREPRLALLQRLLYRRPIQQGQELASTGGGRVTS
jgi:glucosyl-3-phosphoglycerate synthase